MIDEKDFLGTVNLSALDLQLRYIVEKVIKKNRITIDDGLYLFQSPEVGFVFALAHCIRRNMHQDRVYFNKNLHLEPSNICVFNCRFCTYSKKRGEEGSYENSMEDMLLKIESEKDNITEVHIVGGAHPGYDLKFYCDFFSKIKSIDPKITIKALTAVELQFIMNMEGIPMNEGLQQLINCGLGAIPGGGAEIFDEELRKQICKDKVTSEGWLLIHKTAHQLGLTSNATMLFGHIETIEQRIDHMRRLRELQDETQGFNAFIPLKFRNFGNNKLNIQETSQVDVLKTFAVSRIFLDNIPHIKAYWPDVGVDTATLALSFGADDFDGTVQFTNIYSNRENTDSVLSENTIISMIRNVGMIPVERDTNYNILHIWDE